MHAKRDGKAQVERNNYSTYSMDNNPIIPDWKIVFPKASSTVCLHTTIYAWTLTLA
jgi:hypothetical protein